MAWTPKISVCEHCENVVVEDTTGAYNTTTNQTGYGAPSGPTAYTDLTSYTLEVFKPGTATTGAADFTLNLLTATAVINADGNPEWTITADDLDEEEPVTSGVWYFRATAVWNSVNYYASCRTLFVLDVQGEIDDLLKSDPVPAPLEHLILHAELQAAKASACCGATEHAQDIIDWIYGRLTAICC